MFGTYQSWALKASHYLVELLFAEKVSTEPTASICRCACMCVFSMYAFQCIASRGYQSALQDKLKQFFIGRRLVVVKTSHTRFRVGKGQSVYVIHSMLFTLRCGFVIEGTHVLKTVIFVSLISIYLKPGDVFLRARTGTTPPSGTNQWEGQRSPLYELCSQT